MVVGPVPRDQPVLYYIMIPSLCTSKQHEPMTLSPVFRKYNNNRITILCPTVLNANYAISLSIQLAFAS